MNIAEILENCPKGTKLYCSIFGEVELYEIRLNEVYPITVCFNRSDNSEGLGTFSEDGKLYDNYADGECVLFPSKENRDWSTFKTSKKEYEFKPFDKVLVRDDYKNFWNINLFSYIDNDNEYKYMCLDGGWKQCVLFEGNEHLLGTNNPA